MSKTLPNMLETTISKIREMVDVNSVVGNPITTPDGVTIIPVSKVSVGIGGGGSDFTKNGGGADTPFGGGAGAGLDLKVTCYTVTHDTIIDGSGTDHNLYVATMGAPVMKSMSLSGLQGFCQCANAHVSAPATAGELDAIDSMVNGGFFIE